MVYPALHAPIAWGMAKVAQIKHGAVVVDPMVGRGATLIEAQRSFSDATYIGFDTCPAQLSAARGNVAAAEATIELSLGDATKMTLENDSVDVFLCDMPFGKRHGTQLDNCVLYPLVLSEMRRVLRVDGVAVILTTCKRLIEMQVLEGDGWRAVSRDQVVIGAIKGWIHKIEKCGR
jgi:tRNA G10  N-methylase Trm11